MCSVSRRPHVLHRGQGAHSRIGELYLGLQRNCWHQLCPSEVSSTSIVNDHTPITVYDWDWHPKTLKLEGPDAIEVNHLSITYSLNNSRDHQGTAVITQIHGLKGLLRPHPSQASAFRPKQLPSQLNTTAACGIAAALYLISSTIVLP